MDEADLAQQSIEFHLRQKLTEIVRPETHTLISFYCVDCGKIIPEARRQAQPGCVRCINCQQEMER